MEVELSWTGARGLVLWQRVSGVAGASASVGFGGLVGMHMHGDVEMELEME